MTVSGYGLAAASGSWDDQRVPAARLMLVSGGAPLPCSVSSNRHP